MIDQDIQKTWIRIFKKHGPGYSRNMDQDIQETRPEYSRNMNEDIYIMLDILKHSVRYLKI